ncbi:maleylacetoacetate isomerase [Bosea sp. (in: a-proteobacteria)]|jgi:maleylpyruvate isomerase|uniref:maleylacetoacetate isomerase n=1 Tax=Bosea sp. (in: a-proteobacteria) TaxID=1871050 RepID=UPI002DDCC185|nr:maleylacetoacetate isomerase [Bosea sp. (in: a-proteobacteria)]HEV2508873.1 maleylacetoacetate isomerase [Bosea sp. (in: a-proteobacteria)]
MKLYVNEVSSATARVRIALALKGLKVEEERITIFGDDATSRSPEFRALNPQGLVPALLTDKGALLTQSLAIVGYLDEIQPEPALLPAEPEDRAFARSIALAIVVEIHALLPPRIGNRLRSLPGVGSEEVASWNRHWVSEGLGAVEALIARRRTGRFVVGDRPSIADIVLFPQMVGATRIGLDIAQWPNIAEIAGHCRAIPAFAENAPVSPK